MSQEINRLRALSFTILEQAQPMDIASTERSKVLVVDDSSSSIKMFTAILAKEYDVSAVTRGGDVVRRAQQYQPDLILLDVIMPDMDGYSICEQLKTNIKTHHIPVIFVTANTKGTDETRGLDAGAVDYIFKPFDPVIIKTRIRNHLKRDRDDKTIQRLLQQNRMILDAAGEGIYGLDTQSLITFINPAACSMLGWQAEDLIGKSAHALLHHSRANGDPYPDQECSTYAAARDGTVQRNANDVFWRKDGSFFPVEYVSAPIREPVPGDQTGLTVARGVVVLFRDISQQKLLEAREVRSQISRIAISALLETSLEPLSLSKQLHVALQIILSVSWLSIEYKGSIFLVDEKENSLVMAAQLGLSDVLLELCAKIPFGYCLCGRAAQSKQLLFRNCVDGKHDVSFDGMHQHGHYCVPILFQSKLIGVLNLYLPHNHPQDPEEDAFVVTIANTLAGIIMRRQLEEQLEQSRKELDYLARHDKLTGLPNRMLFQERLQQNLIRARRERTMMAVLFIDLDRFKYVNDTFGHETGDILLVKVATAIQSLLRAVDTVARMGGDEFTVILSDVHQETDVTLVAEKIIEQLQTPFHILDNVCEIGASIGISLFPVHASDTETLLKKADVAMYHVKEQGRNNFRIYDRGMESA